MTSVIIGVRQVQYEVYIAYLRIDSIYHQVFSGAKVRVRMLTINHSSS